MELGSRIILRKFDSSVDCYHTTCLKIIIMLAVLNNSCNLMRDMFYFTQPITKNTATPSSPFTREFMTCCQMLGAVFMLNIRGLFLSKVCLFTLVG